MRKLLLLIFMLPTTAFGQQQLPQMPAIDAYTDFIDQAENFSFTFSRLKHYGLDAAYNRLYINDIEQNSLIGGGISWAALGSISAVALERGDTLTLSPFNFSTGGKALLALTNRAYSYRVGASYNLLLPNGWGLYVDASRRFGRSLSVDGLFADAWSTYIGAEKRWKSGQTLSITAIFAPTERAYASPSTREAFELVGSNLYNPAWGNFAAAQRSTNVRKTMEPIIIVNHNAQLSAKFELSSAVQVSFGENSRQALNWQSAPNPLPDYYRYMPSAQASDAAAAELAHLWRTSDAVQQVDFEGLYSVKSNNGQRAKYMMENRVNRPLALTALSTLKNKNFDVGIVLRYESQRTFKTVADLLGGGYWLDIDNFVEQDEDIKDKTQNNLRNPNRKVVAGDRFGYDFAVMAMKGNIWGRYKFQKGRWALSAYAAAAISTLQRQGFYEKENFPSGRSYGASAAAIFGEFTAALDAKYSVGSMLNIDFGVSYSSAAPSAQDIFVDSRYRNFINPNAANEHIFRANVAANYKSEKLRAYAALHYITIGGGVESRQMYDDIANQYIVYAMSGIERRYMGLEAAAEIMLVEPLWLNVALFLQSNIYSSNPTGVAYRQSTGEILRQNEAVGYSGLHTALSPQTAAVIAIAYRPYGWVAQISASLTADNHAAPTPLRRTAAAAERLTQIATQERLPVAISVDIFGGYNFRFTKSSLGIYASLNNILNNKNICSAGYESSRMQRSGGSYPYKLTPQPNKYYYALPLNFSLNVTYRF